MEIVRIFGANDDILYSVKFYDPRSGITKDETLDALAQLYDKWNSPLYLRDFFKKFEKDFRALGRKEKPSDAARLAKKEGKELLKLIDHLANDHKEEELSKLFKPLAELDEQQEEGQRLKAYGESYKSYMRIYAIKNKGKFYVTGGAIKLTQKMQGRPHLELELYKLKLMRELLEGDIELVEYYTPRN